MGHSLFLLFFSVSDDIHRPPGYTALLYNGLSILPSCLSHQFHFVNINKTWTEAQSYCRQNHTDLASIDDMADMNRLNNTVQAELLTEPAWIGLSKTSWRWSAGDTELEPVVFWEQGQPDNRNNNESCVWMLNGLWHDANCGEQHNFVCYDTNLTSQYIVVTENKTWSEAQRYCQKNHKDLASVWGEAEKDAIQKAIQKAIQNAKKEEVVWIGLCRESGDREWRWSDQSGSTFRNWMAGEPNRANVGEKLCVEVKFPSGEWNDHSCITKHHFICYDDKLVLVSENKTWSEALRYCRDRGMELVSVHNPSIQHWVRQKAKMASSPFVWLGLRYTCTLDFWFWVNGEESCYHNWAHGEGYNTSKVQSGNTGAIERDGGKWVGLPETDKFNFICSKSDGQI